MNEQPATFEESLDELETILNRLEDGETGLEESLGQYERGVALVKKCYGQLRAAEAKIQLLSGVGEDGKPLLQPFEHTAAVETESRRRR